jgi:hypothetical protein
VEPLRTSIGKQRKGVAELSLFDGTVDGATGQRHWACGPNRAFRPARGGSPASSLIGWGCVHVWSRSPQSRPRPNTTGAEVVSDHCVACSRPVTHTTSSSRALHFICESLRPHSPKAIGLVASIYSAKCHSLSHSLSFSREARPVAQTWSRPVAIQQPADEDW